MNRLERIVPEVAACVTSLRRIVDFRNRIIHGYDSVDDVIVWHTVEHHLPALLGEVEPLLRAEPDDPPDGKAG